MRRAILPGTVRLSTICLSLVILTAAAWESAQAQSPTVEAELVAEGLVAPVALIPPPDESGRLFAVDQTGQIHVLNNAGEILPEPFLDVSDRMVSLNENYDERGLLGLAFHPNYADNGRFFVYYSAPLRDGGPSGWDHTSHISEYSASDANPNRADPGSERILLQVDQPQGNHNAGTLAFGPDAFLYISLGDGGGADDTGDGHVEDWYDGNEGGNAQNVTANLLGSILRIDVDNGDPYGIPGDNPFVGREGLDEIYAYGFRNPYRFSFDMGGDNMLLVGDAGQGRWEEVSRVDPGGNYGWNIYEGAHCFDAENNEEDAASCPDVVGAGHPDEGAPLIGPVVEYANVDQDGGIGHVVVGGHVYRGSAIPELEGRYIFGDWSASGDPEGVLLVATPQDEGLWPMERLETNESFDHYILAFGQDTDGEVYVLTSDTRGPSGNTGRIFRFAPAEDVAAEEGVELPGSMRLSQNYPNPFNPSTRIDFELAASGDVTLRVFDTLGREVQTLVQGVLPGGQHSATWDGTDASGRAAASGVYLYTLQTETTSTSRVMTLIR